MAVHVTPVIYLHTYIYRCMLYMCYIWVYIYIAGRDGGVAGRLRG